MAGEDEFLAGVYRLLSTEEELITDVLQVITDDRCDLCKFRYAVGDRVHINFPCLHTTHRHCCIDRRDHARTEFCTRCNAFITHLSRDFEVPYPDFGSPVISDDDEVPIDLGAVRFVPLVLPSSPPRCRLCRSPFVTGQRVRVITMCGHQYCEAPCWPGVIQTGTCVQCDEAFDDDGHFSEDYYGGEGEDEEEVFLPQVPEFQTDPITNITSFTSPPVQASSTTLDEEQILEDIRDAFGLL